MRTVLLVPQSAWADMWTEVHHKSTQEVETLWDGAIRTVTVDVYWVHFVADNIDHAATTWKEDPGHQGLEGPLHQAWGLGIMATPEMMQIENQLDLGHLTAEDVAVDTHLLLNSAKGEIGAFAGALEEGRPSVFGQTYAVGDYFGRCAMTVLTPQLDLPFLQVVVPRGPEQAHLRGWILMGQTGQFILVDEWLGIPEPATLALLAAAAGAVLVRRRRGLPGGAQRGQRLP